MATISSLNVKLTATTGAFSRAMKRAQGTVKAFGRGVANVTRRVFSLGGAIVGVAGIGGFALLIRQSFKAGDAVAKTADSFGIATEKLKTLQVAAALGGVETEQFNKSMKRMLISAGDLAQGMTEAKHAYDSLGLSLEQVVKLAEDPFEMFIGIGEALKGVASNAERAAVLNDVFGRQGIAMRNVLRFQRKELEALQKTLVQWGAALGRVDLAKFEMANDSITIFTKLLEGARNYIAISLAPVITAVVQSMTKWGEEVGGIGKQFDKVIRFAVKGIGTIVDVTRELRATLKETQADIVLLILKMRRSFLDPALRGALKTFFKVPLGDITFSAEELRQQAEAAIAPLVEQSAEIRKLESASTSYLRTLDEIIAKNQKNAEAIAKQRKEEQALVAATAAAKIQTVLRFGFKTARELGFDPTKSRAITATNNIPQQQLDELRKLNRKMTDAFLNLTIAA